MLKSVDEIIIDLENRLSQLNEENFIKESSVPKSPKPLTPEQIHEEILQRFRYISSCLQNTALYSKKSIYEAIEVFRNWMVHSTIVRIIGAGRARLAGSIPANRLAHGGARVFIQDDYIPLPHTIKGGGILAVSASGETQSVLNVLASVKDKGIYIVGIANKDHKKIEPYCYFKDYCDIFIGIVEDKELPNPLKALADTGEYVISELLDAMVVAAGKLAGFDDTTWRLGHENIGPTGPYNFTGQKPTK